MILLPQRNSHAVGGCPNAFVTQHRHISNEALTHLPHLSHAACSCRNMLLSCIFHATSTSLLRHSHIAREVAKSKGIREKNTLRKACTRLLEPIAKAPRSEALWLPCNILVTISAKYACWGKLRGQANLLSGGPLGLALSLRSRSSESGPESGPGWEAWLDRMAGRLRAGGEPDGSGWCIAPGP